MKKKKQKLLAEKEAKILPELTFKPKISNYGSPRTIDDFFQYNLEWKNRSKKRIESKRAEIEEKITAELKFVPEIDTNSANMVEQMGTQKPIEVRLLERQENSNKRKEAKRKELACPFTPVIDSRSRAIVKKKSFGNVYKRLFSLSIDGSLSNKSPKFGDKGSRSHSFTNTFESKSLDMTFQ